jgi:hypothetical protein
MILYDAKNTSNNDSRGGVTSMRSVELIFLQDLKRSIDFSGEVPCRHLQNLMLASA